MSGLMRRDGRRTPATRGTERSRWAGALAASILIALAGWAMYALSGTRGPGHGEGMWGRVVSNHDQRDQPGPTGGPPGGGAGHSLQLSSSEAERQARAFANVSEVFEGRASWIALAEHDTEVGVSARRLTERGGVLLLRLVMSRGERIVSDASVVIVPGEAANLTMPFEGSRVLHYEIATTTDRPRNLSLWAEMRTQGGGGRTLAALATTLRPRGNEVLGVGHLATSSGKYKLKLAFSEAHLPRPEDQP